MFLIQPLHGAEGFLGRHLVELIGIPLQLGKIVEHGRRGGFFGGVYADDPEFPALHRRGDPFGLFLFKDPCLPLRILPGDKKPAQIGLYHPVIAGNKVLNRPLTGDDQREGGGLHPPSRKLRAEAAGEGAGDVQPHHPVGLRPADRRLIEGDVIPPVLQAGEAIPDGFVSLGGDPQPFHRLAAPRFLKDPAGDQFPLPPRRRWR